MRLAYVTAGTVGAGHVVRGVALARALARAGAGHVDFRLFTPPVAFAPATRLPFVHAVAVDAAQLLTPAGAEASALARALVAFRPDLVVVDLFWAPVAHVLPLLGAPAWLLVRSVPAQWFQGPPSLPFRREPYARVFAIEPCDVPVPHERLAPIVSTNPDELLSEPAALQALGLDARSGRVPVVMHAGQADELAVLRAAAPPDAVTLSLHEPAAPFPAAPLLSAADRLWCGAGYNTFWEVQRLGLGARTHFTAFARRLDDQAWRVRACAGARVEANGADQLVAGIVAG